MGEMDERKDRRIIIDVIKVEGGDKVTVYSDGLYFHEIIGTLEIAKMQIISHEIDKAKEKDFKVKLDSNKKEHN